MVEVRDDGKWKTRLDSIAEKVRGSPYVKVGWPEGATYPDGTSLPLVAWVQEFGATIKRGPGKVTIYRKIDINTGEFYKGGQFVPKARSNYATEHAVGAYTIVIPPRPFVRTTIEINKYIWPESTGKLLAKHDMDAIEALKEAGEGIKSQLVQAIQNVFTPPLAKSTVRKKKFALDPTKPLVDTGWMWMKIAVQTGRE